MVAELDRRARQTSAVPLAIGDPRASKVRNRTTREASLAGTSDLQCNAHGHLVGPLGLSDGMRLVLCSDGLHGVLSDDEISNALRGRRAEDAAVEVLRAAAEAGSLDDVSVIVCELAGRDGEVTSGR